MNIIISSLDAGKVIFPNGQPSTIDIDSMKLWIAKELNQEEVVISLETDEPQATRSCYYLIKEADPLLDKQNYFGYRLTSDRPVPANSYMLGVNGSWLDGSGLYYYASQQVLADEHSPIYIIGRKIDVITTQIVAQDANSQQFTFYIKKKYDGISFLDPGEKKVYIDFIPVDGKMTLSNGQLRDLSLDGLAFLSDAIKAENIFELEHPPAGQVGEWLAIKWDLPYDATRLAGNVKFALSVLDESTDTRAYTWQTLPSSFTVSPNLGFRTSIVLPQEEVSVLAELTNRVDDLEELVGYQSDDKGSNDREIIFNGGGAPTEG